MKYSVMKSLAAASFAFVAGFPAFAGSDPMDPDCPVVVQLRHLARQVDVMNSACYSAGELCDSLQAGIDESISRLSVSPVVATNRGLAFNPDRVFEMFDLGFDGPLTFDCDPEDDDCDGRVVNPRALLELGWDDDQIGDVLLMFPATNLPNATR